ncbi:dihydrolipoyl dehydrogenase [Oceanobacillus sp. CFH 90083]|uniref:dihydrolipoyl dehydrogenase n=1 Tax=Oceanobacillus sp. CFH 90083 TaxID=2592336 RepID=UPI00128B5E5F|nr:dihydrolipoyl dehydrogenase [Oceanobacillus sp. CFH 90083]
MTKFDVAIIGGGPGGYVAAIRAAKLGLSVALVEGRDLGGTCLNRGCIPSKTLLKNAEVINQVKEAKQFGVQIDYYSIDINTMIKRKNQVIGQLRNGINSLLKANKIKVYNGYGTVAAQKRISVDLGEKTENLEAESIILANGSKPFVPSLPGLSEIPYDTSDTIFDIEEVPDHLVIVGGGVIGLEIACIFQSLGTKVEIIEMADRIIPAEDKDAADFLAKELQRKGILMHTNAKVLAFKKGQKTIVQLEKNGQEINLETDKVLVSVGREPNLTGLDDLSVDYDGKFIKVDKHMQTNVKGIYAIGDLIGGYQLAHAASEEGIRAVNHILGEKHPKDFIMPRCIYTFPEIASVGMTEEQAKAEGYQVKSQKVDLAANGKGIASAENSGFMKIISEKKYGEILGVIMAGAHVTEIISQATSFMYLEGTVEELEDMIFPHPTLSEAMFEAAAKWLDKGIHY